MGNVWITIYKDTYTKCYNGDDNLMEILIPQNILIEFYNTSDLNKYYDNFRDFFENYFCEDVDKLFEFAYIRGAILDTDIY